MKKSKMSLFVFFLFSFNSLFAGDWGPWITVYKDGDESLSGTLVVQISFNPGNCEGNAVHATKYRIRITKLIPNCKLKFKFDFIDCQGKKLTENALVDMSKEQKESGGDHFFGTLTGTIYDVKPDGACAKNITIKPIIQKKEIVYPASEKMNYAKVKVRVEIKINSLTKKSKRKTGFLNRLKYTVYKDQNLSSKEYKKRKTTLENLEKDVIKELVYQQSAAAKKAKNN